MDEVCRRTSIAHPEPEPPPRRRRKLLFVVAAWILVLLAAELAARLVLSPRALLLTTALDAVPNLKARDWFRPHPGLFWEILPDLDRPVSRWGDRTNALGFRGVRNPEARGDRTRVLCLGDSCTYGLGLPWNLAWPALLDEDESLEVLNAGVPGYSSHQGRVLFEDRCREIAPDVLVVQFGTNDANLWRIRKGGVVHCLSDQQVARHLAPAAVARVSALAGAVLSLFRPLETTPVPDFDEADHGTAPPRVPPDRFRENLRALTDEVSFTVVLIWPLRCRLDPTWSDPVPASLSREYRECMLGLAAEDIVVVDLLEVFRESGLLPAEIYADDVHATARGARLVADAVGRALRRHRGGPSRNSD